jgi:hypothetical protein
MEYEYQQYKINNKNKDSYGYVTVNISRIKWNVKCTSKELNLFPMFA